MKGEKWRVQRAGSRVEAGRKGTEKERKRERERETERVERERGAEG